MARFHITAAFAVLVLVGSLASAQDCLTPIDLGLIDSSQNGQQDQQELSFPGKLGNASCTAGGGGEVVFSFTIPSGQSYAYGFALLSQNFDGALVLLNGSCDYAHEANCNDDYPGLAPGAYISGVLDEGSYWVVVDSFLPEDRGSFVLYWEFNKTSDDIDANSCAAPHDLGEISESGNGTVAGDTWSSANHLVGALPCSHALGRDIIYNFSVPANTWVHYFFNVTSDDFEAHLILTDGQCSYNARIACDHWHLEGTLGAGHYWLAVEGDLPSDHGAYTLEWVFEVTTPEPVNNTCDSPYALGVINDTLIGSHLADSSQASNNWARTNCGSANGNEVIYEFIVPDDHIVIYDISVVGNYFTVLALLNNSCNYTRAINCNAGADVSLGSHIAGSLRAGTYWLAVDGRSASSSGVYWLKYNFTTSPVKEYSNACHDAFDLGAIKVPLSGEIYGDSSFALSEHQDADCSTARGPEVVFKFTIPAGYWVDFVFASSGYDTVLVVTQENCNYRDAIYCNDDYPGWGFGSRVQGNLRSAGTYYLILDGFSSRSRGLFWLSYKFVVTRAAQLNNTCDDPYDLGTISESVSSELFADSTYAANNLENASCSDALGHDVVFKFVVPDGQWVEYLFTIYSDYDSVLVLSHETCGYGAGALRCNDDYPGLGFNSRLAGILPGGTYYLSVDGWARRHYGVFLLRWFFNVTNGPVLYTNACENPYDLGVINERIDGEVYGDSSSASNNHQDANCSVADGPDVVFSFTVPAGNSWRYAFIATGEYDTVLVLLKDQCDYNQTINCNDDYDTETAPGASFITGFIGEGSYYLVLDGASANQSGHFALDWHFLVPSIASNATIPPANNTSSGSGSAASASAASSSAGSHSHSGSDDHSHSGSDDNGNSGSGSRQAARALAVNDNELSDSGVADFGHPFVVIFTVVMVAFLAFSA